MALFATVASLLFVASAMVIIVSLLLTELLCCYANEVKWIKKESESLKALVNDFGHLLMDVAAIETKAGELWDSEINLTGMHPQLSNDETQWMESIRIVVTDAEKCVDIFNKLSQEPCLTACFRLVHIVDSVLQTKRIKREIVGKLTQNEMHIRDIYDSMERSRSKNRSMLHVLHTLQETSSLPILELDQMQPSTSIIYHIMRTKEQFCGMEEVIWSIYSLLLLHIFLIDVSQLMLETETQMVWVKQANELIAEAEKSIVTFRRLVLTSGNNLILRNKFTREMKNISTDVDNLLTKKGELYHFAFIDRAEENSISFSIDPVTDFSAIISEMKNTLNEVSQHGGCEKIHEINLLINSLENLYNKIYVREAATFRSVCLEQIKCIAQELKSFLEMYMREPALKHFNKLKQIERAITILQRNTQVCYFERQCSSPVVDIGSKIQELVSMLTTRGDNYPVISIVGIMGIGKTTLAKEVYNNRSILNHFSRRAWVTMPINNDGYSFLDPLKEKLSLVVFDKVTSTEQLDEIIEALSEMANGSRIVITTRFQNVASCARSRPYHLQLKTKEDSWKLFQMVTSKPKLDTAMEKLAREVVGRCGGLPLSILSLHSLIMSTSTLSYEQLLIAFVRINQGQIQRPLLDSWHRNYEQLGEIPKKCLLHFTLFPQDIEIPTRRLVVLCIAEGLVETPEVAEKYLEELRVFNMIQAVELKSNGKIKTCRIPSVLREHITGSVSLSTHLQKHFTYPFEQQNSSPSRILSVDTNLANVIPINPSNSTVSVLFFDTREEHEPGKLLGDILSQGITNGRFLKLRVLDLERVYKPQLSSLISKLIELRYLGLRWTYLDTIPSFIGKLSNLETLDIKHTCIFSLPHFIWKLKKLRNLYLSESIWRKIDRELIDKFPENLETLCGVFIDKKSTLLHGMHRLKTLRKLKLTFQLIQTEQEVLVKLIVEQEQLHSLTLRSIDENGKPADLCLGDMSKLCNLSFLYLFGKLDGTLRVKKLPPNITHLTLSASRLSYDPMPQIQKLSMLRSLCLCSESYTGISMVCIIDSFPQLQVMRFWMLKDLEEWTVENGAMPNLIELEIRCCSKLKVPSGLKHLKNLHKIKLSSMPENFIVEIEENKRTFWNNVEIICD